MSVAFVVQSYAAAEVQTNRNACQASIHSPKRTYRKDAVPMAKQIWRLPRRKWLQLLNPYTVFSYEVWLFSSDYVCIVQILHVNITTKWRLPCLQKIWQDQVCTRYWRRQFNESINTCEISVEVGRRFGQWIPVRLQYWIRILCNNYQWSRCPSFLPYTHTHYT